MSGFLNWILPNGRHKLALVINHNIYRPDLVMIRFFNEKSTHINFNHPPAYVYWYTGLCGGATFIAVYARMFLTSPELMYRRGEYYKPWPDKHYTFAFSMPHFNHSLRAWSAKYRASFMDNEPDFNAYHPWAVRPNRNLHYARLPFIVTNKRYFIDDPLFEKCLHSNVEKRYEELGYYPDRKKLAETKEDDEE